MLSFCIKTVHSLLALSPSEEKDYLDSNKLHCLNILSGLSLVIGECLKPANVVESVSVKKDSNGFVSGSVMEGMSSCTESLGSESSDQLEEEEEEKEGDKESRSKSISRSRSRLLRFRRTIESDRRTEDGKKKIFPPPISSLSQNGHPSSYLKSVRKNGRLEITEVKFNRPEILRASRQNGRLTLHLIQPEPVPELEEKLLIKESDESVEKSVQRLPRRCYDHRAQLPIWSNSHCVMTG